MKFLQICLIILFFSAFRLTGQEDLIRCNIDHKMEAIYQSQPNYEKEIDKGFNDFNRGLIKATKRQMTVTIPVHVIMVHEPGDGIGQGSNLSFDHVMSQIDVLNEDFGRYNSDAGNTPGVFQVGDTGIQFCLATVDPNGNATNGITRYPTTMDFDANEVTIKNATRWPRDNYLNIWVAELNGVLGYAYLPTPSNLPNASVDGVAVGTPYFGGPGYATGNPYHLGRTATHEVGHFLGLRHVWRNAGCGSDDGISDTPLQDIENYGCPSHPSPSCSNSGDMFMNYMDYVNDNCMNAFSIEQGNYMNTILSTSRASLAGSAGFACAAADPLSGEIESSGSPLCYLGFDGFITAIAEGGSGNYTFTLNNGQSNTTGIFENLSSGFYTITIEDGNDIIDIDVELIDPDQLEALEDFHLDNTCFGGFDGSISIYGMGGTSNSGMYLYQINFDTPQEEGIFESLANGSYQLTVIDENNCTAEVYIDITSPSAIELNFTDTIEILCSNDTLGGFAVVANGGTPEYTYSIGNGFQTENLFDSLPAGVYMVQAKDMNDCIMEDTIELSQPDSILTEFVNVNQVTCQGSATGGFTINTSGGANNYSYYINGNSMDSNMAEGLVAGQYIVATLDTNGCQILDTIIFTDPAVLTLQIINSSPPVCQESTDGFFIVEANGGTPPYQYSSDGTTNNDGAFDSLLPDDYQVTVTDARGCATILLATVVSNPEITNTVDFTNPLCNGNSNGSISVVAAGGSGPFNYQLGSGPIDVINTFNGLSAQEYIITSYDQIGCTQSTTIELLDPEVLSASQSPAIDECGISSEWTLDITINGGTMPYSLTYNGDNLQVDENSIQVDGNGNDSGTIVVTDTNGCETNLEYNISLTQPLVSSVSLINPASCDGTMLGTVQLALTGGSSPYVYLKDGIENTSGLFNDLEAGFHQVTGLDANGCEIMISFSVPSDVEGFEISAVQQEDISCFGAEDGTLMINVVGSQGPFLYELNGNLNNDTGIFDNLPPDSYSIKVIDQSNNCVLTSNATITEPDELSGDLEVIYGSFEGENKIVITPDGGTPPYQFAINDPSIRVEENEFRNLNTDNYIIYIIDANECVYQESFGLTNTSNIFKGYDLKVYPNPADEQLSIAMDLSSKRVFNISLIDITGKTMAYFPEITFSPFNKSLTFSVKDLNSSIYIVKIATGNEIMYRKVLVR